MTDLGFVFMVVRNRWISDRHIYSTICTVYIHILLLIIEYIFVKWIDLFGQYIFWCCCLFVFCYIFFLQSSSFYNKD